jgi:hypothetical protein
MIPNISKDEIKRIDGLIREQICLEIRDKLLYLEKYSTSKDNNKITYVMVPKNHPVYPFPYNLEDRMKDRLKQLNKLAGRNVDVVVKKQKNEQDNQIYLMTFTNDKYFKDLSGSLEKLGFKLKDNDWTMIIE